MKRAIWIFGVLCFYSATNVRAQTVSFNFSLASHPVTGWINVSGDPSVAVRTATDGTSGIGISSVGTANWVPYNSASAYDAGGVSNGTFFPAGVMVNHWYQYSGTLANYNAAVPQLIISGLNKDSVYSVSMTSSNIYALISNPTQYTVSGLTVLPNQNLNTYNNVASGVSFVNVSPDATGKIKVYVNTIATTQLADISGVQIIRGHTTVTLPTVAMTSPDNNDTLAEESSIVLNATASEAGKTILKVEFFSDAVKLGESLSSPYSFMWNNPGEGRHTIMAKATDNIGTTNTATIILNVASLGSYWSTTGNIATNGDSNFIGTVDTNRLALRTNNLERVSILKDGTVGIGTKDTKGYLLAVNGTAIFTKVKVKTAGTWPDYVFKKGYHLPDLKELQQYISQHQHLPGIIPEAEAQNDGIDVAAHEAALLKKIEELTLYLIRQNERLEKQQKEIDELKQQVKAKK